MSDTVTPEQALVLSVGIERYAYGCEMDLPGAGAVALRFAEWALGCGIPPQRVLLATTWAGEAPQIPAGVNQIEPNHEALRKTIIGLRTVSGELLLIFWCGHGVLDLNDERALYTADATEADKRNVGVEEMLRYLASNTMMSFPRQIAFIDACANFVEGMGYDEKLPRDCFPAGKRRRRIPQFSFYSAGQGQIAAYKRADRESTFSLTVLDWLEQYEPKSLSPDLAELTDHVLAVFDEKRKAGELQAQPVYLWVRTPEGSQIKAGDIPVSGNIYQRARVSVLSASQVQRVADRLREVPMLASSEGRARFLAALVGGPHLTARRVALSDIVPYFTDDQDDGARSFVVLRGLAETEELELSVQQAELCWRRQLLLAPVVDALSKVTFHQVQEAFFAAMPPGTKHKPRSLEDALETAGDRLPSAGEETALHRLVARLEHTSASSIPDEWYRLSPDRLNAVREKARAERPKRASLVIDLRNLCVVGSQSTSPETIDGHLHMPDGNWDKTTVSCEAGVEAAVCRLLDDFHARHLEMSRVGLIVPRVAFDLVPESWGYGNAWELPTPIWRRYPTILHCGDRLNAPPEIRTRWSTKAAAIKAALVTDPARIRWLEAGLGKDPSSISQLVRDASEACFGLEFAPGGFGGDLRRDPLIATVAGGAPFLIWVEHEPADWNAARDIVVDLIDSGSFDELPERVRHLRADHGDGLGDEIRLVWDEPECLPPFGKLSGL